MDYSQFFGNFRNKRRNKRADINLLINYSNKRQIYTDYLKDISLGGARIETLKPPNKGDMIIITIPTKPPIKINASVKWVLKFNFKYQFGVEFDVMTYANETILSQYLGSIFWDKNDYLY
jgi:hypothetical protein